jgi:hypothetical protein
MIDDLEEANVVVDDGRYTPTEDAASLPSVPLKIRLILAGIFIAGLLMVYLLSLADRNRSNREYVQQSCRADSARYLDACK